MNLKKLGILAAGCAATLLSERIGFTRPATVEEELSKPSHELRLSSEQLSALQPNTLSVPDKTPSATPLPEQLTDSPHPGPSPDKKHAIYGSSQAERYRLDYSIMPGNDLEQAILFAGRNQRERNLVLTHTLSPEENQTLVGVRLFPWRGDLLEIKLAGQDQHPREGEDAYGGLLEVTIREFLRPPHQKYLKMRGGVGHFRDGAGSTTEGYFYGRHTLRKRLNLLGTVAVVEKEDFKTGDSTTSKNLNGGVIVALPNNHYLFGGLAKGSVDPPLTWIFGLSKAASDHDNNTLTRLAYLADFRINPKTTFMLFGLMYGEHNQFGRDPTIGIIEGLNSSAILNSQLSRARRFEATENAVTLYELAPFALFGVYLREDLGQGMELTTYDWKGSYVLWQTDSEKGPSRLFVANEVSKTRVEDIPHVGVVEERANCFSLGAQWPIGRVSLAIIGEASVTTDRKPIYQGTLRMEWPPNSNH